MNQDDFDGINAYIEAAVEEALGVKAWVVEMQAEQRHDPYEMSGYDMMPHMLPGLQTTDLIIRLRLGNR